MLVEIVFARPGLGRLIYDAIPTRNYPVRAGRRARRRGRCSSSPICSSISPTRRSTRASGATVERPGAAGLRTLAGSSAVLRKVASDPAGALGLRHRGRSSAQPRASRRGSRTHDPDALDVMNRFAGPPPRTGSAPTISAATSIRASCTARRWRMGVALTAIAIALGAGTVARHPRRLSAVALGALHPDRVRHHLVLPEPRAGARHRRRVRTVARRSSSSSSRSRSSRISAASPGRRCWRCKSAPVPRGRAHPRRLDRAHRRAPHPAEHPGPADRARLMDIPVVITIEAGLSFLGLGVRPPLASWGTLIQDGYSVPLRQLDPRGRVERRACRRDARLHPVRRGLARRGRPAHPAASDDAGRRAARRASAI